MPLINFKTVLLYIALSNVVCTAQTQASQGISMEKYYSATPGNLAVWTTGKSFIKDGRLLNKSKIQLKDFSSPEKIIMVWSGEIIDSSSDFRQITLKPPKKPAQTITADKTYEAVSAGTLYSCFSDITHIYDGGGSYHVTGLVTDI